ncbi:MAG TPA: response regulator [Polyangiaceae bacterium]|nr:response regulator [Polyangiaceae bacterium]
MNRSELACLEGARVLIVEGHDDTLELNRMLLAYRGANVRVAGTAEAALDLMRKWPPDAVLTDLRLPGMSAFELVGRACAPGGDRVPVVGTSADVRPQARALALGRGVCAYLTKPVEPDDLCSAVAQAVGARCPIGPRDPGR